VNAILTQVTNGVRTNSGETLRGAAAIAYLRDQFENAGGTAARFREQMLNTFEGQKQLLAGSLETLAIVAGEPFAQVFKPLVTIVVEVVNAVLNVFRQLPAPVKRAFAAFVVGRAPSSRWSARSSLPRRASRSSSSGSRRRASRSAG
jgi:hypothetical protein